MHNGSNSSNDDQFPDKILFVVNEDEEVDKCPAVTHLCIYDTTRKCLKSNCCHMESTIALNVFIVYSDDPN